LYAQADPGGHLATEVSLDSGSGMRGAMLIGKEFLFNR
jgi:hypothetical protein